MVTLIGGLLAFTAGIVTAASWDTTNKASIPVEPAKTDVKAPPSGSVVTEPSKSEILLAGGPSRIVADEVRLKNQRLRYEVEMRYPQIIDSSDPHIKSLNERIKRFAVDRYQWTLNPSREDLLRYRRTFPEAFNSVELNYEILSASDLFLSIYFNSFNYGIGAAHSIQTSYTINYDLKLHRELKLADLFKPNSRYLEFISLYCTHKLSPMEPLAPTATTFASWNITEAGIRFNFDACTLKGCADGAQKVTIPFTALQPFLKTFP